MRWLGRRCLNLLLVLLLAACGAQQSGGQQPERRELRVFAAASLTEAFLELGALFEREHPGVEVSINFAGSQQLLAQLAHGANADLFAPASVTELQSAVENGLVVAGSEEIFAANSLLLIAPYDNPARLQTLGDLARPGVKLVIADESVPAGRYTLALLANMEAEGGFGGAFQNQVLANVVSREENVRGVVSKVRLGEADAGIVYSSDVAGLNAEVLRFAIPAELNPPISYPIAPLAQAREADLARQFIDFARSQRGQQVLSSYGFISLYSNQP